MRNYFVFIITFIFIVISIAGYKAYFPGAIVNGLKGNYTTVGPPPAAAAGANTDEVAVSRKTVERFESVYHSAEFIILFVTFSLTLVLVVGLYFSYKELNIIKEESARLKKEAENLVSEKNGLLAQYNNVINSVDNHRKQLDVANEKSFELHKAEAGQRVSALEKQVRVLQRSADMMMSGTLNSIFDKLYHINVITEKEDLKEIEAIITEASLGAASEKIRAGALLAVRANGTSFTLYEIERIMKDPDESEEIRELAIEAFKAIVARNS